MSPEQLRGEKLDARTDLFSFGLVLYEMAAGQRAFTGNSVPMLRAAILEQTPTSARQLNPAIPFRLEMILNRALEKAREKRYQSAEELATDLRTRADQTQGKKLSLRTKAWMAGVATVLLVAPVLAINWFMKRQSVVTYPPKLVQLTANSSENWVLDSAISPDGKLLAYSDRKAIFIKNLETNSVQNMPAPSIAPGTELPPGTVAFAWFPDSLHIAITANPMVLPEPSTFASGLCTGIWILSLIPEEPPRKLRDDGCIESVSPNGATIAFVRTGSRSDQFGNQIWLMGSHGEEPHQVFDSKEHSRYEAVGWSPDGTRLVYFAEREEGDSIESVLLSRDLRGGPPLTMLSPPRYLGSSAWLPNGRLIYSLKEPGRNDCNFWETPVNRETGQPLGQPRRLSNWTGICMDNFSVSADSKRLAFHRYSGSSSVYVADLLPGPKLTAPQHLTLSEDWNTAFAWTANSKAVIFSSDRNSKKGIFKQAMDSETPESIITGLANWSEPQVSPEGDWVLYTVSKSGDSQPSMDDLVRVPINGGAEQVVLTAKTGARLRCAKKPAKVCLISERTADNKQLVFTAFDPVAGRGRELRKLDGPFSENYVWALSADGTQLAMVRSAEGPIEIVPLQGGASRFIAPKGWSTTAGLDWAPDGKGLFITGLVDGVTSLMLVDLKGHNHVLWSPRDAGGHLYLGTPSPDGRHIAMTRENFSGNIWMMENF